MGAGAMVAGREDANLHESHHCGNLDDGKDKLCLAVPFCAKEVDDEDNDQEHGYKDGLVEFLIPIPYRHGAC